LDHRSILAGIFWVIRTGASWREVPEQFGPWQTINTRYRRWRQAGIWQQILDALMQDESSDRAG
jgi:transposase